MAADGLCFFAARLKREDCDDALIEDLLIKGQAQQDPSREYVYVMPEEEISISQRADEATFALVPAPPERITDLRHVVSRMIANQRAEVVVGFWLSISR